jgi:hypothetical protein
MLHTHREHNVVIVSPQGMEMEATLRVSRRGVHLIMGPGVRAWQRPPAGLQPGIYGLFIELLLESLMIC